MVRLASGVAILFTAGFEPLHRLCCLLRSCNASDYVPNTPGFSGLCRSFVASSRRTNPTLPRSLLASSHTHGVLRVDLLKFEDVGFVAKMA